MTSLDRALIKAFAEQGAANHVGERLPEKSAKASWPAADGMKHEPARANVRVAKETISHAPQLPRSGANTVAPLSAFASPARPHESFRALLEVDHLAWPPACDALIERARAEWDRFAERLSRHASQLKKCLALTSCRRGEGRTSVALAAARLLAARGLRSVVVDADFQRPNLADSCGISAQAGWGEVLSGELSLGEVLITATKDGVALLPWRAGSPMAPPWTNTLPIATNFSMLREHYDLVLLDTMPLDSAMAISEFASLAETIRLDATFVIFDARSTPSSSLTGTCAKLRRSGLRVEGLIENFGSAASRADVDSISGLPTVLVPAKRGFQRPD